MVVVVPDAAVRQGPHSRSVFRILKQLIIDLETKQKARRHFLPHMVARLLTNWSGRPMSSSSGRPFTFCNETKRNERKKSGLMGLTWKEEIIIFNFLGCENDKKN